MQKKLLYIGIILLITGIAFLIYCEMFLKQVNYVPASDPVYSPDSWILQANLTSDRTYLLYIESADEWGQLFQKGIFDKPQPVNISITSPDGGITKVQAMFYGLAEQTPLYPEGRPPQIVEVSYFEIDSSSLQPIFSSSNIIFKVKKGGTYTVTVLREGLASLDPPNQMMFYEETMINRKTYSTLVFCGGFLSVVGSSTSVWCIFKGKRSKTGKKSKR